jgi:DNA-binding CsgD family transcriptional regulator
MRESAIEKLSEAQKACLRLVQQGYEVKEIARLLETTPGAVTERLRAARQKLDAASSRQAARTLAQHESQKAYTSSVTASHVIADDAQPAMLHRSITRSAGSSQSGGSLREEQAPYLTGDASRRRHFPWPIPIAGKRNNDLTIFQTMIVILGLTIGLAAAALLAIALVDQMSRLRLR